MGQIQREADPERGRPRVRQIQGEGDPEWGRSRAREIQGTVTCFEQTHIKFPWLFVNVKIEIVASSCCWLEIVHLSNAPVKMFGRFKLIYPSPCVSNQPRWTHRNERTQAHVYWFKCWFTWPHSWSTPLGATHVRPVECRVSSTFLDAAAQEDV